LRACALATAPVIAAVIRAGKGERNGLEKKLALGVMRLEGEGAGVAGGWICGGRMVHGAEGRAGLSCMDGSASGRHGEEDGPARWGRRVSGGARVSGTL